MTGRRKPVSDGQGGTRLSILFTPDGGLTSQSGAFAKRVVDRGYPR